MRFVFVLLLALAGSFAVAISACGPVQADCGPQNCDGCCAENGRCQLGQLEAACGTGGMACATCPSTQICQAGACVPFTGGDAGCTGCRDAQGTCHAGRTETRCGSGGEVCVSCAGGEVCEAGQCVTSTGCKSEGVACALNGECCTNICSIDGVCLAKPDAGGGDGGMDGGDSDGGTDDAGMDGGGLDGGGADAGTSCPSMNPCKDQQGPGDSSCACVQTVCSQDPYCCTTQYDSVCSQAAQMLCTECSGGGGSDGGMCQAEGAPCFQNSECCLGVCDQQNGFCWAGGGSDGGPGCFQDFTACTQHSECCGNFCEPSGGFCWSGGSFDGGSSDGGTPTCFPDGAGCSTDPDCCSFFCDNGICASATPALACGSLGTVCTTGNDCCSATCDQGACVTNPNGGAVMCGGVTDICQVTPNQPASPPTCDPCVQAICAVDSYCCNTEWDNLCVDAAVKGCDGRCAPPPPSP